MTKHIKLAALLMVATLTFSCQKEQNVEPQKPVTHQTNQVNRASNVVELYPLYLSAKIKVYNDYDLRLGSRGEVISARLAEDTRVQVASNSSSEKATFMKGKLIFFDVSEKVVGALFGRLKTDASLAVRGSGKIVKFWGGKELQMSSDRNNLGVVYGTLGNSVLLGNEDGTSTYYPKGTLVTFNEQGLVSSVTLP